MSWQLNNGIMKRFWGFVIKEFHHIFRDTRTILVLFGMPVAQMLLFGFVVTNEIKDARVAILDHSRDNITQQITNKILSSGYFVFDSYLDNEHQIEEIFKAGKVKEVIVFEPDFAGNLIRENEANVQLIADASDANMANLLVNYTSGIIMDYAAKRNQQINIPVNMNTKSRMIYNPSLEGVFMFVPGIMAMILMLISALMTSISIVREKELGTMEVLLVSPLKPLQIIIGKVTPYVLLSFVNAIVIIILGRTVFGLPVQGSVLLLLLESILFILLALSLGIFISTVTDNQMAAMLLSLLVLMLPTILLSGFIFPIENMPEVLQWLTHVIPPRWFITIIKNIMIKGTGMAYIWKETLILLGMTAIFIILSVKKFKVRLE